MMVFQRVWKSTRYIYSYDKRSTRIRKLFDFRNDSLSLFFPLSLAFSPRPTSSKGILSRCKFYFSTDYSRRRILGMRVVYDDAWARLLEVCQGKRAPRNVQVERYWKTYEAFVNRVENNGHARLLFLTMEERSPNSVQGR